MATDAAGDRMRAWRPDVPGVREVLHAELSAHSYPLHVHDEWSLLLIDRGAVDYRLGRRTRRAPASTVSVLPPGVAHDGQTARAGHAFRKRVVYLEPDWIEAARIGAAVDDPLVADPAVARLARRFHAAVSAPGDEFAAESLLRALTARIATALGTAPAPAVADAPLAARLRTLLDARLVDPPTLAEAGAMLGATPEHLIRTFARAYGIPPHRYAIGRRVEAARRLLLDGVAPADVAARTGFADQAHLTRTFRRTLGTTPARFAA
jgi:AraC-like DNA-binding protein